MTYMTEYKVIIHYCGLLIFSLILLIGYRKFLRDFFHLSGQYLGLCPILVLVYGFVYGQLGSGFGVQYLFWHDRFWVRVSASLGITLLLAVIGTIAYYADPTPIHTATIVAQFLRMPASSTESDRKSDAEKSGRRGRLLQCLRFLFQPSSQNVIRLSRFLRVALLPFLVLLFAPALLPAAFPTVPHSAPVKVCLGANRDVTESIEAWVWGVFTWVLGIVLGIVIVKLLLRASELVNKFVNWLITLKIIVYPLSWINKFFNWIKHLRLISGLLSWLDSSYRSGKTKIVGFFTHSIPHRFVSVDRCDEATNCPLSGCPAGAPATSSLCLDRCLERKRFRRSIFTFYVIFILVYIVIANYPFYDVLSPAFAICAFLGIVAMTYALAVQFLPNWKYLLAIGLVIGFWACNKDPYKLRFEKMEVYYPPGQPVLLREQVEQVYFPGKSATPKAVVQSGGDSDLIKNELALNNWRNQFRKQVPSSSRPTQEKGEIAQAVPESKPKLVVVAVSGGATRSAFWTAIVLDRLEQEIDDFGRHVRIITGASGGMLGAAYYVLHRHNEVSSPTAPRANSGRYKPSPWVTYDNPSSHRAGGIPLESLNPVAKWIALRELWHAFLPGIEESDRGMELEKDWEDLRIPFKNLRALEEQGNIPSLIFSPMIIEDGRRLLISNLDLRSVTETAEQRVLAITSGGAIADFDPGDEKHTYSLSALEFFRLFPKAKDFYLSTAVRMNGSFPYVSPAVNLPTSPPRRVVDAGYYDNYGVQVAASWIYMNREALMKNTSGVLLVEIRDSVSQKDRLEVDDSPDTIWGTIARGFQFLTSPIEGFDKARYASGSFRNDKDIQFLSDLFTEQLSDKMKNSRSFFTTIVFENTANVTLRNDAPGSWPGEPSSKGREPEETAGTTEVAMDWYLTEAERTALINAIPTPIPHGRWDDPSERRIHIENIIKELAQMPSGTKREVRFKQLEQLRNYERLDSLKAWWVRR